jgi:hypothetical protein
VRHALLLLITATLIAAASAQERTPWKMDENYQGAHQASFQRLRYEVPILMRQTLIDIAVKLGLDFRDGWAFPMTVRFVDTAPWGAENVLAYVHLFNGEKGVEQTLNINLAAYAQSQFDFDKVFKHELTHAMLNDAFGEEAALKLPIWLHEGVAVFAADQGEKVVKAYVYSTSGFSETKMLNGLEGPHGALDYAEDYLAIKYINSRYGVTGLHTFMRDLVAKKGNIPAVLDYSFRETWDGFQKNVHEFAKKEIKAVGPAKRGQYEKPY